MADVDEFLAAVLPQLTAADTALHNGDPGPRMALWSHEDRVSVFGAVTSATGWREVEPMFERLGSRFSACESLAYEVLAARVSGDLGYVAGMEHTPAAVDDAPAQPYTLRVTTVMRREAGEWRVVHRHADPVPNTEQTDAQMGRLSGASRDR